MLSTSVESGSKSVIVPVASVVVVVVDELPVTGSVVLVVVLDVCARQTPVPSATTAVIVITFLIILHSLSLSVTVGSERTAFRMAGPENPRGRIRRRSRPSS